LVCWQATQAFAADRLTPLSNVLTASRGMPPAGRFYFYARPSSDAAGNALGREPCSRKS
jgi:hypothetical protein